jgi:hypothetical protein
MLPYHFRLAAEVRSFGSWLEPRYIFGASALDQ